ncbi:MAG: hypothetical protein AB7D57_12325 [Desulfovibrionaceae bacterium]
MTIYRRATPKILLGAALLLALALAGHALAVPGVRPAEMVLDRGQSWQLSFPQGDYGYTIEYLGGDLFVTVEAEFMDEAQHVVYKSTHTLVQDKRMSAEQRFSSDKVAEVWKTRGIRFVCDSGKVRITFRPF